MGLCFCISIASAQVSGQPSGSTAAEDGSKGQQILLKVIDACGGLNRFRKIKSYTIKTESVLSLNNKDVQLTVTETVLLPDKSRQVMELPSGTRVQVLNGKHGWSRIGSETSELSEPEKREMNRALFREVIRLFQLRDEQNLKIEDYGEEMSQNQRWHVLRISNQSGDFLNLYVDAETYLPVKKTYQGAAEVNLATLQEIYSDYRSVDGIKIPFHIVVRANGRKFIESRVIEAKMNPVIDTAFFEKGN